MTNYFISSSMIKTHFSHTGLDVFLHSRHTIKSEINGKEGWVVDIPSMDLLLQHLGAKIVNKLPTGQRDVIEVILTKLGSIVIAQKKIVIKPGMLDEYNGRNKDMFKNTIQEIFVPETNFDCIDMRTSRGNTLPLTTMNTFFIHIWSSPDTAKEVTVPNTIWDIQVDSASQAYSCSWSGVPIVDDQTGYAVAELIDNNLYIHHNLVEYGSAGENKIFKEVLLKTAAILRMNSITKSQYIEDMTKHKYSAERLKYIDHCRKRIKTTVSTISGTIKTRKKEIDELQSALMQKIREAQALENKIDINQYEKDFGKEFDKLRSMKKIINIEVGARHIDVFTKTLYCKHPTTKSYHEIGKFKITIPTIDGGAVKWHNLTRKVDGHQSNQMAPHIWQDGSACLGNTQTVFPELIAQYEFSTVAMLAIEFVESVNISDSAGKHLNKWPVTGKKPD